MAYESFPNDAHNARAVTLAEHEQIAVPLGLSGLLGYSSDAPVFGDSSGMQVKLRSGVRASIRGTRFNNTSETTIAIGANSSGDTRIDLVVLRLQREESGVGVGDQYTVVPYVIAGTPASTPVAPAAVRDDTLDGTGVWDIPLAEVTVIDGATGITAGQVTPRAYFVTGSGYTGRDGWGKPPPEPGIIFRANDTGISWICSSAGTWQRLYHYSNWSNITTGQTMSGWDPRNFAVAREGNLVVMTMYLLRTGGTVGASTWQYFGPIPQAFRPNRTVYGVAHCTAPDHSTHTYVDTGGVIGLAGDNTHTKSSGAQVLSNMTWLCADGA